MMIKRFLCILSENEKLNSRILKYNYLKLIDWYWQQERNDSSNFENDKYENHPQQQSKTKGSDTPTYD